MEWEVVASQLNLRDRAVRGDSHKALGRILTTLNEGTRFRKLGESDRPGWWRIEVARDGMFWIGEINASPQYVRALSPSASPVASPSAARVTEATLGRSREANRASANRWHYSIGEAGRPGPARQHSGGPAAGIRSIIDWLDVGNETHGRWWPSGGKTFCNVYCHDVCDLAGCYLPRVWWSDIAYAELKSGQSVQPKYGTTAFEQSANDLFHWLANHGRNYGWVRIADVDTLQQAANSGQVCVISARNAVSTSSGHIQIVAPEAALLGQAATRVNGRVTQPLQSNAGAKNFTYGQMRPNWWSAMSSLREFAFWSNALL